MVLGEGGLADAKAVGEARSRMMKTKLLSLSPSLFLSVRTERGEREGERERERLCDKKYLFRPCGRKREREGRGEEGG